jgi:hypothetical protein
VDRPSFAISAFVCFVCSRPAPEASMTKRLPVLLATAALALIAAPAFAQRQHAVLDLWNAGKPAFGVFVPNENPQPFQRGQPPPKGIYTKDGGATSCS